jgi:zinc protease
MKITTSILLFFLSLSILGQNFSVETSQQQKVEFTDNPNELVELTLNNGMKVYLNHDPNMHMVLGAVVVRGGAKYDPKDATGIAHYLEHMLFKGTSQIGTLDYKEEKKWLDSLANMYELLQYAKDDKAFKQRIYKKIDYFSQKAAQYAVPGELSKMITQMGGRGLNAFTDFEKIVYHNAFPAEYMAEWLEIYKERFDHAVFRLFQTELETVFEEKNMSQDNMYVQVYEHLYKHFYPNSTYGQQTILGSVEHLKTPSPAKMLSYYKEYYIANNMALILVGNFNKSNILTEIERSFGAYRNGDKHNFKQETEPPFVGRVQVNTKLTPVPIGILGFRIPGQFHQDMAAIDLFMAMMSNSRESGLLDSLKRNQKIMFTLCMTDPHSDIGGAYIGYAPKFPIQSLKQGEKLIQKTMDKVRQGHFSNSYYEGVKRLLMQEFEMEMENPNSRMRQIAEVFVAGENWKSRAIYIKTLEQLDKKAFLQIVNQYFGDNYLAFYSKRGSAPKQYLQKPQLTPIKSEEGLASDYYTKFSSRLQGKTSLAIIEKDKDYASSFFNPATQLIHTKNPYNQQFNYHLRYFVGDYHIPGLEAAVAYFNQCGTQSRSRQQLQDKLLHLGTSIQISSSDSYLDINMNGLDKYFDESLILLNELLQQPELNNKIIKPFISDRKLANRLLKRDAMQKAQALAQYAVYGKQAPLLQRLSTKEIKKMTSNQLVELMQQALNHKLLISYGGSLPFDEVENRIRNHQYIFKKPKVVLSPVVRDFNPIKENKVYLLMDKKAVQSQVSILVPSQNLQQEDRMIIPAYNLFFGSGLNAVVFKEIREYKALAYGAYASFRAPYLYHKPGYLFFHSSTQIDKTEDLLQTSYQLLDSLNSHHPEDYLIDALQNSINTSIPDFRNLWKTISYWQIMGYNSDPREERLNFYTRLKSESVLSFHENFVANRPKYVTIISRKDLNDLFSLEKFGELMELKLSDIYTK